MRLLGSARESTPDSDYRRSGYKYLLLLGPAKGHRFNPCPTKTVWRNSTYLNPSSRPEQLPQLFFPGIPAANAVITDQRRSRPVVSHSIIFRLPKSAVFGMGKPTASSLRFRLAELVFSDHSADAHVIGTIIWDLFYAHHSSPSTDERIGGFPGRHNRKFEFHSYTQILADPEVKAMR
jgi:hypothetical protein